MQEITRNNGLDYLIWRYGQSGTIEIYDIAVGSHRGKGIGTSMLNQLKNRHPGKHLYAFAREENILAEAFYKKNGFMEGILIPNFYMDGNAKLYIYI